MSQPVSAQEAVTDARITVLASGVRAPLEATGQEVAIFGRAEIDRVQGPDLTRLLERAAGVTISRNGGPGAFTSVRLRGAAGEQTLVVLDGVRMADPAAPGGGFDFGTLLMGNLGKVEIERSSNSTIWGSDAIGGVIAVTSAAEPGPHLRAAFEGGSFGNLYTTAAAQVAAGPATLVLRGGHFGSTGFSAAAAGTEPDGFRQDEASGRLALSLAPALTTFASGRYAAGRSASDGFPAPLYALADTAEYQDTRQRSGATGLHYAGETLDLTATASLAVTARANFDPAGGAAPTFTSRGDSHRIDLRGRWGRPDGLALDFGGEREWLRYRTLFDAPQRTASTGGYAQLAWNRGALHLAGGVRRDEHAAFGGQWSLGSDAAVRLGPLRLTASYGEGFKAPSLFQLHSDYGNTALRPERSRSFDAAVAVTVGAASAKLTAFRRDTRDLIDFVSCYLQTTGICTSRPYGTYDNLGQTRSQGIEAEGRIAASRALTFLAAYTYLDARDRTGGSGTFGKTLARRPHHALTASADWTPGQRVRVGGDVRWVSGSFDDAANIVPLAAYAVATLRGEWDLTPAITLFARVENLFDDEYQTAAGYANAGRGGYLGARAKL